MASQKQKKSLSKSKLGIIPNVNKGVYISNKQKALVVILLAMVITLTTTAVVRMFRTQSANQSKLEQMIHAEQNLKQIDTQKQTDTQQKLQQQIDELKLQVKLKKESKIAQAAEAQRQALLQSQMAAGSQRDEPAVPPECVSCPAHTGETGSDHIRASRRRKGPHSTTIVL